MKEDINMPAHVHNLDRPMQAKSMWGEIVQADRFNVKRRIDCGKVLNEIAEECLHGEWTERLNETGIPHQRASEMRRAAKLPVSAVSNCNSWAEVLDLLLKQFTTKGDVPFEPAETTQEAPLREEPGEDESYQQQLSEIDAKIKGILCQRCTRIGKPACDRCIVKAFNIQNNIQPKPPAAPRKSPSNNGQLVFDWGDWRGHFGHCVRSIDKLACVTGTIIVNPELEGLRRLLDDWQKEFRKTYEKLTGQKPPRIEF